MHVLAAFPGEADAVLHATDWRDDRLRRLRNHAGDVLAQPDAALERAVLASRPELVHTHNLSGISTAAWAVAARHGLPVVHTLHDYWLLCPRVTLTARDGSPCSPSPLLCGFRTRRLARWAGAVRAAIGVSRFVLARHAGLLGHAALHVVRHPVLPPPAAPAPPRPVPTTLGYIGSLDRIKGVELLLEADLAGLRLRVAGDGRLRGRVEAAGIDYAGVVSGERKRAFLAHCDIGIVPSVWDEPGGPPYTVIEWLAAGRPVLASRRGGLGEALDGLPGAIGIEPTPDAITGALRSLVEPTAWAAAVAAVGPIGSPDDLDRWLDDHERIYAAVA